MVICDPPHQPATTSVQKNEGAAAASRGKRGDGAEGGRHVKNLEHPDHTVPTHLACSKMCKGRENNPKYAGYIKYHIAIFLYL